MNQLTVKLNNGREALAKQSEFGPSAKAFSNRTQAYQAAFVAGENWEVARFSGRPFYVVKKVL